MVPFGAQPPEGGLCSSYICQGLFSIIWTLNGVVKWPHLWPFPCNFLKMLHPLV